MDEGQGLGGLASNAGSRDKVKKKDQAGAKKGPSKKLNY